MAQESACPADAPVFAPERDLSPADGGPPQRGWEDGNRTRSPGRPVACSTGAGGSAGTEATTAPRDWPRVPLKSHFPFNNLGQAQDSHQTQTGRLRGRDVRIRPSLSEFTVDLTQGLKALRPGTGSGS